MGYASESGWSCRSLVYVDRIEMRKLLIYGNLKGRCLMAKKYLLIISCKEDPHTDYVINKMNQANLGHLVVRLNTEDIITNAVFNITTSSTSIFIKDSDRRICSEEIGCVWYRRPESPEIPSHYPSEVHKFVTRQVTTALKWII